MKKTLILLIILSSLFSSCISSSEGLTYKNETIPDDIINELNLLDQKIIDSMGENNCQVLEGLLSKKTAKELTDFENIFGYYASTLKDKPYLYLDRYYAITRSKGENSTILFESQNKEYTVHGEAIKGQTYISLILFEFNGSKALLTLHYQKTNKDWKVRSMHLNDYSYYNMNANDLYKKSVNQYEKNELVSSGLYANLISSLLNPSPLFQYINEKEMTEHIELVSKELTEKYKFPKSLTCVKDTAVYGISIETISEGLMPVINYVTNIDLTDIDKSTESTLKLEAETMHNEVVSIYKGLGDNFSVFLYKAYSEPPIDSEKQYLSYATVLSFD